MASKPRAGAASAKSNNARSSKSINVSRPASRGAPAAAPSPSAPKQGSSGSDARPISNYAIHKGWGGTLNFMHSHGLRMWDMDDVDTMHRLTDEIRADMMASRDAPASGAAASRGGKSNR